MINFIESFLFPLECYGCGKVSSNLCDNCNNRLIYSIPECYVCRRVSSGFITHENCLSEKTPYSAVFYGWQYNSITRKLLHAYKYRHAYKLSEFISGLLFERFRRLNISFNSESFVITSIPLHSTREKERGFNQVELICKGFAKRLNIEYTPILERIKKTESQSLQSKKGRVQNVRNSFQLSTSSKGLENGKGILIMDDVITTGSTLNAAAQEILKGLPNSEILGIGLFRGKPRFSDN